MHEKHYRGLGYGKSNESLILMSIWPKQVPVIGSREQEICDEFMADWHRRLGGSLRFMDRFNHSFVVRNSQKNWERTLDLGAGLGEHFLFEQIPPAKMRNYQMVEMRENMAKSICNRFPEARVHIGDCQNRLPFPDQYFDRILAIHVLEHLPRLPDCLKEVRRLLVKKGGNFIVVIPCEGGGFYSLARRCSVQRISEKKSNLPYDVFIRREHLNSAQEIITEIKKIFQIRKATYFPFVLPSVALNLFIGLSCAVPQVEQA